MGIQVEFNPELTLRSFSAIGARMREECLPKQLEVGKVYPFLKKGQRNYYLEGEIPLRRTKGNGLTSRPKASVIIVEATHFLDNGIVYTKGTYEVVQTFTDTKIQFEGFERA